MRRRRVEAAASDRFVERLLGLELTQDHFDRGRAFVDGVVERAGREGLDRLWSSEDVLPTPNEVVHVVRNGEHLTGIASRYGSTVRAIMERNGLRSANLVFVGQELSVPLEPGE